MRLSTFITTKSSESKKFDDLKIFGLTFSCEDERRGRG